MTVHLITMLVLGIGIGACLGWMAGVVAGRQGMLRDVQGQLSPHPPHAELPLKVRKREWPPAPEPTDWEDFEQRTDPTRGEREYMFAGPRRLAG